VIDVLLLVLLVVCSSTSQQHKPDADTKTQSPTSPAGRRRVRRGNAIIYNRKNKAPLVVVYREFLATSHCRKTRQPQNFDLQIRRKSSFGNVTSSRRASCKMKATT